MASITAAVATGSDIALGGSYPIPRTTRQGDDGPRSRGQTGREIAVMEALAPAPGRPPVPGPGPPVPLCAVALLGPTTWGDLGAAARTPLSSAARGKIPPHRRQPDSPAKAALHRCHSLPIYGVAVLYSPNADLRDAMKVE